MEEEAEGPQEETQVKNEAMIADGWVLPGGKVPVCEIKANNLAVAKDRLLGYISQYGRVTESGLAGFLAGLESPDVETLELPGLTGPTPADMAAGEADLHFAEIALKPYKKTHVLLSFPPELFGRISEYLEPVLLIEGVEYEQGSN